LPIGKSQAWLPPWRLDDRSRMSREVHVRFCESGRGRFPPATLLREGEHVKFAFIQTEKALYPIAVLCDALQVSRAGYYAWTTRPVPLRAKADAKLAAEIAATHKRSRATYGSPRVHKDLRARGVRVGKKRVERLMREGGIAAKRKRRFRRTTDSNHQDPIAPNVLDRKFHVEGTNRVWVTDVTYIWSLEGWLYLAAILDLCSRRVVGWAVSATNDRQLALSALQKALAVRTTAPGLLHHSDRGSPYASEDYRSELTAKGLVPSMSRRGDCWDNAVAESFFATLKGELVDHETYVTRADATASIGDYIDNFYNVQRRHSSIDYMSPTEFELKLQLISKSA
jgi:putative transposase